MGSGGGNGSHGGGASFLEGSWWPNDQMKNGGNRKKNENKKKRRDHTQRDWEPSEMECSLVWKTKHVLKKPTGAQGREKTDNIRWFLVKNIKNQGSGELWYFGAICLKKWDTEYTWNSSCKTPRKKNLWLHSIYVSVCCRPMKPCVKSAVAPRNRKIPPTRFVLWRKRH